MSETDAKFTYVRLFTTIGQVVNGASSSLALTFGYRSREMAEKTAEAVRALRQDVLSAGRDAAPVFPDIHIEDDFGNDFTLDVRLLASIAVVDPIGNSNLSIELQIINMKAQMHGEERVKQDQRLSNWLKSRQQGGQIIHPGHQIIQ